MNLCSCLNIINEMSKRKLGSSFFNTTRSQTHLRSSQSEGPRTIMNFFSSRSSSTPSATLIAFYAGTGRDHRGRRLNDILEWGANKLESSHDYIQTLFPLPEESGVNWSAPVINREVFEAFRSRPELREKLRDSFKKMLWFYGFELKVEYGRAKVSQNCLQTKPKSDIVVCSLFK